MIALHQWPNSLSWTELLSAHVTEVWSTAGAVPSASTGEMCEPVPLMPQLGFDDDETSFSYAARLAAFHTGGRPRLFLLEHGVTPDALMRGKPDAVEQLEQMAT